MAQQCSNLYILLLLITITHGQPPYFLKGTMISEQATSRPTSLAKFIFSDKDEAYMTRFLFNNSYSVFTFKQTKSKGVYKSTNTQNFAFIVSDGTISKDGKTLLFCETSYSKLSLLSRGTVYEEFDRSSPQILTESNKAVYPLESKKCDSGNIYAIANSAILPLPGRTQILIYNQDKKDSNQYSSQQLLYEENNQATSVQMYFSKDCKRFAVSVNFGTIRTYEMNMYKSYVLKTEFNIVPVDYNPYIFKQTGFLISDSFAKIIVFRGFRLQVYQYNPQSFSYKRMQVLDNKNSKTMSGVSNLDYFVAGGDYGVERTILHMYSFDGEYYYESDYHILGFKIDFVQMSQDASKVAVSNIDKTGFTLFVACSKNPYDCTGRRQHSEVSLILGLTIPLYIIVTAMAILFPIILFRICRRDQRFIYGISYEGRDLSSTISMHKKEQD